MAAVNLQGQNPTAAEIANGPCFINEGESPVLVYDENRRGVTILPFYFEKSQRGEEAGITRAYGEFFSRFAQYDSSPLTPFQDPDAAVMALASNTEHKEPKNDDAIQREGFISDPSDVRDGTTFDREVTEESEVTEGKKKSVVRNTKRVKKVTKPLIKSGRDLDV